MNEARSVLNGWKEIATYVGRGVRTVQRWEGSFAFPVRRPAGRDRSAVFAIAEEVDLWLKTAPKGFEKADLEVLERRLDQLEAECRRVQALISAKRGQIHIPDTNDPSTFDARPVNGKARQAPLSWQSEGKRAA